MRNSRMRLAKLAPQLILRQMREQHRDRILSRERPLQEVYFRALSFLWEGQDEVGVFLGGGFDCAEDVEGNDGAEGLWVVYVPETPDCF